MKDIMVYTYPFSYAREHGEVDMYRLSNTVNTRCRDAIEDSIRTHYRNNSMNIEAVRMVVEEFGLERTQFVLANTLHHMMWDARYSRSNKNWAGTIIAHDDPRQVFGDGRVRYLINSHPGLVDLFVTMVRQVAEEVRDVV